MIRKKKICSVCGKETYIFSKGLCQFCASKKFKKPERKFKQKDNKVDLDNWFIDKITDLKRLGKSEESGELITYPTRLQICHIFNKRNHPSVAYHPENYVFLTGDEHTKLDNLCLDRNDFEALRKHFPNSFETIMKRAEIVLQSVTERTKFKESLAQFLNK